MFKANWWWTNGCLRAFIISIYGRKEI